MSETKYKEFNIKSVDKESFICLKFPDSSMYYGEMAYFDEDDNLMENFDPSIYDQVEEEEPTPEEEELAKKKSKKKGGKSKAVEEEVEDLKPKKPFYKRKRHGRGIQAFYRPDNTVMCKYEGHWSKDEKHGWGKIEYPDGSYYRGELEMGTKNG